MRTQFLISLGILDENVTHEDSCVSFTTLGQS